MRKNPFQPESLGTRGRSLYTEKRMSRPRQSGVIGASLCVLALVTLACRDNPTRVTEIVGEKKYEFSTDWTSRNTELWETVLTPYKGKPNLNYLEVGTFEGRTAVWMLDNVLTHPGSRLTGIDTYPGTLEERYRENLRKSGAADKTTTIKGYSQAALKELSDASYDIIYVDGSHLGHHVLADATLSWDLLKPGGLLIFDDYGWTGPGEVESPAELNPKLAIDGFMSAYRNHIELIHKGFQVVLKKRHNPCPPGNACSPIEPYYYSWRKRQLVHSGRKDRPIELTPREQEILESILHSRSFGEVDYAVSDEVRSDPDFIALRDRLDLQF